MLGSGYWAINTTGDIYFTWLLPTNPFGQVRRFAGAQLRLSLDVPDDTHLAVLRAPVLELLPQDVKIGCGPEN